MGCPFGVLFGSGLRCYDQIVLGLEGKSLFLIDSGEGQGKSLEGIWDKMLNRYYTDMGWDDNGKPLSETLKKFGLGYVAADLWK